jgi:RNA polymerase sigma-70 factor, ECF subfamily
VAFYTRRPGEAEYRAVGIDVLRLEDGRVARIDAFLLPQLFPAFGLAPAM